MINQLNPFYSKLSKSIQPSQLLNMGCLKPKSNSRVYNIGQKVLTLFDGAQTAGYHTVTLDASQLPSGVYVYSIRSEEGVESKIFTLIK